MQDLFTGGIPQPLFSHQFRIDFFNDIINKSLMPVVKSYKLDILKKKFTLKIEVSDHSRLANYLNELSNAVTSQKVPFLTKNISNSVAIEYLTRSGKLGSVIVIDKVVIEELVMTSDYAGYAQAQELDLVCDFSKFTMYSSSMAKKARYGEPYYDE